VNDLPKIEEYEVEFLDELCEDPTEDENLIDFDRYFEYFYDDYDSIADFNWYYELYHDSLYDEFSEGEIDGYYER